jgi:hypothetical protein
MLLTARCLHPQHRQVRSQYLRGLLYAIAICCAACGRHSNAPGVANVPAASTMPSTAPGVAPATVTDASGCLPSHDGFLRLRMRGASNMDIDWHDADMRCDGGPRPDQQGVRLTFAGPAQGGAHNLRFVFGIAAAPGAHRARNVPTNVTVIFEGERKLFSTAGDGKCTIDEYTEQVLPAQGSSRLRRLSARGFCTAPATTLAGKGVLLLSRFDFAGPILDEDPSDAASPVRP